MAGCQKGDGECERLDLVRTYMASLPEDHHLHSNTVKISHLTELNGTHRSALCVRIGATGAPSIGHVSDECRSHRDTQVAWNWWPHGNIRTVCWT